MSTRQDGELLIYSVMGVFAGVFWFVQGFRELRNKRTIQDIPTSRIATGAVGSHVEIKGKILCPADRKTSGPITGLDCAFYSIEIQKLVRSKNSSHWKTIDQFYSDDGFYVEDGSGADALVFVEGAIIKRDGKPQDFQLGSSNFGAMPVGLREALSKNESKLKKFKLKETSWLFSNTYRFLEWSFFTGESIYVLGHADSGIKAPKKNKLDFKTFLQAKKKIQSDPELKKRFDTDQDGFLNPDELERGARILGHRLASEKETNRKPELVSRTKMVFRHKKPFPFIISNMHEDRLVKSLSWSSTFKVFGGPIVTIASVTYLIFFYNNTF